MLKIDAISGVKVSPVNALNPNGRLNYLKPDMLSKDTFTLATNPITAERKPIITTKTIGNSMHVSFRGQLKNPLQTQTDAIQMKVRGVAKHQKGTLGAADKAIDDNVVKLSESHWKDGQKLEHRIASGKRGTKIELAVPELGGMKKGQIGRVPDELVPDLVQLMAGKEKDFQFELSNIISGNSKSAPTIGLRVNLKYVGNDKATKEKTEEVFSSFLESTNKEISKNVMLYQPKTSPDEVLERIFDLENKTNGPKAVEEIQSAITNISRELTNPENKNILLLGHCKPDGDTLGCVIGMKTALAGSYPDKNIDCAVDDKIPGLFRSKMLGIEDVKRPYNPERIETVKNSIERLKSGEMDATAQSQVKILESELAELQNPENLFDANPLEGKDKKKYDLVVLLDVPTPKRFSGAFKDYITNANKVIYIDHHPHKVNEWNDFKDVTGVDMDKIHENKLALVSDAVPAATQLVTVLAQKAGILGNTMKNSFEEARKFVASVITGTSTDTGSFTRAANLTPEHMSMPIKDRPNFLPEGVSKWLIDELNANQSEKIDKKWLRDNIVFDIPDKRNMITSSENGELSPRDKMLQASVDGKKVYEDIGLGFVTVDYDKMYEIWEDSLKQDSEFSLLDVQNGFKYSETMSALKVDPSKVSKQGRSDSPVQEKAKETYDSPYNDDKIAILMIQDKKKGAVTENSEIASDNGIRLSFRSAEGSDHAELLASIFDGGGHGAAAGGRIDVPGVEMNSKLVVTVNGEAVTDPAQILKEARHNYEVNHNADLTPEQKRANSKSIKVAIDNENGLEFPDLCASIVREIRKNQVESKNIKKA